MLDHGENEPERKKSKALKKGKKKAELADLKKEIELVRAENVVRAHAHFSMCLFALEYICLLISVIVSTGLAYYTSRRMLS